MSKHPNGIQVVLFKRDLRTYDHAPLYQASKAGPVYCLFVYETQWLESSEFDPIHLQAVNESLDDLQLALERLGSQLVRRFGDAVAVLDEMHARFGIAGLWSHEETGLDWSYRRDRSVAAWAQRHGIPWREYRQHGVFRPLQSRDGWSRRWTGHMNEPLVAEPEHIEAVTKTVWVGDAADLPGTGSLSNRPELLPCGRENAEVLLQGFLYFRGEDYHSGMSSPVTAFRSCSRLSSALAYGNLSMREVFQALKDRIEQLKAMGTPASKHWVKSLNAHAQRLRWHCHFMQKLEDEPAIEFNNMNRAYDGLREDEWDEARFQAWAHGRTGYPMVDACMRALIKGGWINFRMRAMLISFAAYHLWLHWRKPAQHLARLFQDFEPGIHYAQTQMQAGTTGINTVRIYSPAKQVLDQDPRGVFVRRYCPELEGVPDEFLAEPHTMPLRLQQKAGCVIGRDYAAPLVDHGIAYKSARSRMYRIRGDQQTREASREVYKKHGSRRRPRQAAR